MRRPCAATASSRSRCARSRTPCTAASSAAPRRTRCSRSRACSPRCTTTTAAVAVEGLAGRRLGRRRPARGRLPPPGRRARRRRAGRHRQRRRPPVGAPRDLRPRPRRARRRRRRQHRDPARARQGRRARPAGRRPGALDGRPSSAHLRAHAPWGAQLEIEVEPASTPIALPASDAAERALEQALTASPSRGWAAAARSRSWPGCARPTRTRAFVLWGAQDSDLARIHAANESVDLDEIAEIALAEALLLEQLGRGARAWCGTGHGTRAPYRPSARRRASSASTHASLGSARRREPSSSASPAAASSRRAARPAGSPRDGVVEERGEPVVVAGGVEHAERLVVEAELAPGVDLDQLLERADPAGERDERVARARPSAPCARASCRRRAARSGPVWAISRSTSACGITPTTSPPAASARRRAAPIRPTVRAAVDDAQPARGERPRERLRRLEVGGVGAEARPAVDADGLHSAREQALEVGLVVPGADRGAQVRVAGQVAHGDRRPRRAARAWPRRVRVLEGDERAAPARRDRVAGVGERGRRSARRGRRRAPASASRPAATSTLERGERERDALARQRGCRSAAPPARSVDSRPREASSKET